MQNQSIYHRDLDQDGLTDAQELALGTDPLHSDPDGDGRTDLEEIQMGSEAFVKDTPRQEKPYDLDL